MAIFDAAAEFCYTLWDQAGNVYDMGVTDNRILIDELGGAVCNDRD